MVSLLLRSRLDLDIITTVVINKSQKHPAEDYVIQLL